MNLYRRFADVLPQVEPELWRLAHPRIYRHADAYGSPKTAALAISSTVGSIRDDYAQALERVPTMAAIYAACCKASQYAMPSLFVAPELLRAALATCPPDELRWCEINLPFEAGVMMLPRNMIRHRSGGAVDFIGYARIKAFEQIGFPSARCPSLKLRDASFVVWTALHEAEEGPSLCRQYNGVGSPYIGTTEAFPLHEGIGELTVDDDDAAFLELCSNIVFRVMLAIEARPTLLALGRRDGTHKKSRAEIWTPNVVGAHYRIAREACGQEPGASKQMHWRGAVTTATSGSACSAGASSVSGSTRCSSEALNE